MRGVLLILMGLAVSACALTTDEIDVPYQPEAVHAPVSGAAAATVAVTAADARASHRDRVGTKKNGYGMEMAPIVATNDVVQTVAQAVTQELKAEGFDVGAGGAEIAIDVVTFYNDFKIGFFTGDGLAEVTLTVKVLRPDKSLAFAKTYTGSGKAADIMLASGSNAREALMHALSNVVGTVVSDPDLITALLGKPVPAPTTSDQHPISRHAPG